MEAIVSPAYAFLLGGPASCLHCIFCLPRGHEKWLPLRIREVREQASGLCRGTLDCFCWQLTTGQAQWDWHVRKWAITPVHFAL